jgi:hypothetical protein
VIVLVKVQAVKRLQKRNRNINKNLTNKKVRAKIKDQKPAVINQNHKSHQDQVDQIDIKDQAIIRK